VPIPRILGFDVGDRRIGLALSDELGYTAQPLFTLHRGKLRDDLKSIARVLRKHAPIAEAVVGNPLYMSGDQSPQAARAQAFADALRAEFGLTIHLWDERLTTAEAHRHLDTLGHSRAPNAEGVGRKNIIDQVAAVLILQAFLEARANARARYNSSGGSMASTQTLIAQAYAAFNDRDIAAALTLMTENVSWPRASEGGRAGGKEEIRAYWTRQWQEFDPHVEPLEILEQEPGIAQVRVRQLVKSLAGDVLFDGEVCHVYTIANGLIERMDLKESEPSAAFSRH
jgi:putative Holliday junction resolvase